MQFRASHILLKDKKLAEHILKKVRQGANFGKLAKEYSICNSKNKNGDLGFFKEKEMVKEFENAVKKLKVNQVSNLVRTKFGYHIIKKTGQKD